MPGIGNNTIKELQSRIERFDQTYISDWNVWLNTSSSNKPYQFGVILRKWQACRPNKMRRTKAECKHNPPYLEDLVEASIPYIQALWHFDISQVASFAEEAKVALRRLWRIFEQLSYCGKAHSGLASVVGISKSVLLLSDGRVGPAFDSQVRRHLNTGEINNADKWIAALHMASSDIHAFEIGNSIRLRETVPKYAHLHCGRIYDMALGPGD